MPPRSKNGSTINSQVSLSTREGGGSVAPCFRQRTSQTTSTSAMTTSGGTMRAATAFAQVVIRSPNRERFGVSVSTFALTFRAGRGTAVSDFFTGMVMRSADFCALDRQALQVGDRIFRIEHLAVEERLLATRLGRGNLVGRDGELLGGVAPNVFAIDLRDESFRVGADLELAPADILGEEPEVVARIGIGREFIPVAHHLRVLLDHLAGNAVVELALDAIGDRSEEHTTELQSRL